MASIKDCRSNHSWWNPCLRHRFATCLRMILIVACFQIVVVLGHTLQLFLEQSSAAINIVKIRMLTSITFCMWVWAISAVPHSTCSFMTHAFTSRAKSWRKSSSHILYHYLYMYLNCLHFHIKDEPHKIEMNTFSWPKHVWSDVPV